MIALAARDDAETLWLAGFEMELAGELDGGFGGFGAAGGEVDGAAVLEIWWSELEEAGGEFRGGFGLELRSVGEGELRGLRGHGLADFGDAVANADDGGLSGGVEVFAVVGGEDPAALGAHGGGVIFGEIAGEDAAFVGHRYGV